MNSNTQPASSESIQQTTPVFNPVVPVSPVSYFRIEPKGSWIEPSTNFQRSELDSPKIILLAYRQTRLADGHIESYQRTVVQINDASHIEEQSQHIFEVEPGNQEVVFHCCTIHRGDQKIDALDAENIRILQRENSLESHVITQRMSVVITFDDLREGDIISIERTIEETASDHPLYGHFLRELHWLVSSFHVLDQRVRVVNNSSTTVVLQEKDSATGVAEETLVLPGDDHEISHTETLAVRYPDNLPVDYWPASITLTSANNWSDVARYLCTYYDNQRVTSEALELPEIPGVDWNHGTDDTVVRVIRFVQDEIRYRSESHFSNTTLYRHGAIRQCRQHPGPARSATPPQCVHQAPARPSDCHLVCAPVAGELTAPLVFFRRT